VLLARPMGLGVKLKTLPMLLKRRNPIVYSSSRTLHDRYP